MSADRRRRERSGLNILENMGTGALSLQETDANIFGNLGRVDEGRQVAKPISIFEIYPDATQPRRAVPSIVRPYWDGSPDTFADLFNAWFDLAVQERGAPFDLLPYLLAEEDTARPSLVKPLEAALLDIVELAANIRRNGLTNPITVAAAGNGIYRLETGERRWFAYHLLYLSFENEQESWEKIPAREVEAISVWRQASENNARANLNAISKARQLAILLMDLHGRLGSQFLPFEQLVKPGQSDRAYYAQVAEGRRYPVPKGNAEVVMNALGFKQASLLSEYRDLLDLPDDVWRLADDLNWTQGRLRDMQRRSEGDAERMVELAVRQAAKEGYRVGISVTPPPPPPKAPEMSENWLTSRENRRRFQRLMTLASRVGEGAGEATPANLDDIRAMRRWLEELEKVAINRFKDDQK